VCPLPVLLYYQLNKPGTSGVVVDPEIIMNPTTLQKEDTAREQHQVGAPLLSAG
jgi:hypothetical protein